MTVTTDHTGTGNSGEMASRGNTVYLADFATGSGVGTANFQVNLAGDWITIATGTADIAVAVLQAGREHLRFRWNVSAFTSGIITTYMTS